MREIRWHGRGGQGAKTVAQVLALALMRSGYYVQSFPEYGPERSGAPVQAYTRVSRRPIRLHCGVTNPDTVVVLDETLLEEVDVFDGLAMGGLALINSRAPVAGDRILRIDANYLAEQAGGRYGNVAMIGALAAVQHDPPLDALMDAVRETFHAKISEAVLEVNLATLKSGYEIGGHNGAPG